MKEKADFRELLEYMRECEEEVKKIIEEIKSMAKIAGDLKINLQPYALLREKGVENGDIVREVPAGESLSNFDRVGMSFKISYSGEGDFLELFEAAIDTQEIQKGIDQVVKALKEALEEIKKL